MSLFHKFKSQGVINRKNEETLYAKVASEMADGVRNSALWLKALEMADGNSEKQISEYIKLRVQSLKDDIHIVNSVLINEPHAIEKTCWENILDVEDLMVMIEGGASLFDISQFLSEQSSDEIRLLINQIDACDQYPLHVAVKVKRTDIIEWLLDSGANYNCKNYWGKTPLDMAVKQKNIEIINKIESYIT